MGVILGSVTQSQAGKPPYYLLLFIIYYLKFHSKLIEINNFRCNYYNYYGFDHHHTDSARECIVYYVFTSLLKNSKNEIYTKY